MTQRIGNPFAFYLDRYGRPLDGGRIYIGTAGQDPEISPLGVFWDSALTIAAAQPLDTIGGIINRNGDPAFPFIAEANYSIRVRDADGAEVSYSASAVDAGPSYQPLDNNLTAIAALAATAYGRALLTMADAADLRAYAGIATPANPQEPLQFAVSDEATALTTGTSKITLRSPYALTLSEVKASLSTAQTSGSILTIDINVNGASILSTKLTIDNTEKTSVTALVPPALSSTTLPADAEITIDIDQVGDGTAKGLKVTLIGAKP